MKTAAIMPLRLISFVFLVGLAAGDEIQLTFKPQILEHDLNMFGMYYATGDRGRKGIIYFGDTVALEVGHYPVSGTQPGASGDREGEIYIKVAGNFKQETGGLKSLTSRFTNYEGGLYYNVERKWFYAYSTKGELKKIRNYKFVTFNLSPIPEETDPYCVFVKYFRWEDIQRTARPFYIKNGDNSEGNEPLKHVIFPPNADGSYMTFIDGEDLASKSLWNVRGFQGTVGIGEVRIINEIPRMIPYYNITDNTFGQYSPYMTQNIIPSFARTLGNLAVRDVKTRWLSLTDLKTDFTEILRNGHVRQKDDILLFIKAVEFQDEQNGPNVERTWNEWEVWVSSDVHVLVIKRHPDDHNCCIVDFHENKGFFRIIHKDGTTQNAEEIKLCTDADKEGKYSVVSKGGPTIDAENDTVYLMYEANSETSAG